MADLHTGVTLSKAELERLAELTRQHGAWLVIDDTYESFLFSGEPHHCPQGPHIIHVFSFSNVSSTMHKVRMRLDGSVLYRCCLTGGGQMWGQGHAWYLQLVQMQAA